MYKYTVTEQMCCLGMQKNPQTKQQIPNKTTSLKQDSYSNELFGMLNVSGVHPVVRTGKHSDGRRGV